MLIPSECSDAQLGCRQPGSDRKCCALPDRVPGDDLSGLDDQQRLFITGHWAAANATTARTVRCEELSVTIPVACRLPLIACKLHAWVDRRDARADKRGSDGLDIVRLLETADFDALADDADVVPGLRSSAMWGVEKVLVEQAARVGRMIQLHTETPNVDTETTEALGLRLLETLVQGPT